MTDTLEAAARGRLAERLVPVALELADLVHGDGDREEITAFLREHSAELGALLVVAAAMIDRSQTPQELLAFITWDELEHPLPANAVMVLAGAGRQAPECGTPAAYERHRRLREGICGECREANAARQRERKQRQQRAEGTAA